MATTEGQGGKCIIFSAPSGSGKTSIVKYLIEHRNDLEFSVSACNRPKRPDEINGKDYYFLSTEEFKQKIKEDAFVEWEEVYENNFYGTMKSEIERIWGENKNVIFDVDVVGGLSLTKYFKEKALAIYVKAPNLDELEKRLIGRGTESPEKIAKRMEKARKEVEYSKWFDIELINDDLEKACKEAATIVDSFINNH